MKSAMSLPGVALLWVLLAAPSVSALWRQAAWQPCGGRGQSWCGGIGCGDYQWADCPSGYRCARQYDTYWGCIPTTNPSFSTTTSLRTGWTTRYWDCCKPSCGVIGRPRVASPVRSCTKSNAFLTDFRATSGCARGPAYHCANQAPWIVNSTMAYGFAAAKLAGQATADCCACYKLNFQNSGVRGKSMIVQVTNTGASGTSSDNHWDIAIPGGGQGANLGCTGSQYRGTVYEQSWRWGGRSGGVTSMAACQNLPPELRAGCEFRWRFGNLDRVYGMNNPTVTWVRVPCPAAIYDRSGCRRWGI